MVGVRREAWHEAGECTCCGDAYERSVQNGAARRGGRGLGEAVDATVGERVDGCAVDAGASGDCGSSAVDVVMGGGLWW